jgi:hypothetical protein
MPSLQGRSEAFWAPKLMEKTVKSI